MSQYSTRQGVDTPGADEAVYRVMIADDSAFIRGAMARALENDPNLQILVSVSNGDQAVKALRRNPVDVIVLDIEMPIMDGMTALPLLKSIDPAVQIIMASTLTQKNAEISLRAMSLGATDYIPKPTTSREIMGAEEFKRQLVEKVKALGALARRSGVRLPDSRKELTDELRSPSPGAAIKEKILPRVEKTSGLRERAMPTIYQDKKVVLRTVPIFCPKIIAIGSSTGGPQTLFRVIKDMGTLSQPVVITQHMPPSFTAILADHISRQCEVKCKEAQEDDVLEPGNYYVAPGDYHMVIESHDNVSCIKLVKGPLENFCRPSVDPMLRSLIGIYGKKILAVILTGMGQDGLKGCDLVVKGGGAVIAQDEATSVVWGMPGAVATAGLCSAILPADEIGGFVREKAMGLVT